MGLRTASVRRPYAEVMAPALTETATQSQTFKFQPPQVKPDSGGGNGHLQPASPLNGFEARDDGGKYLPDVRGSTYHNNNSKAKSEQAEAEAAEPEGSELEKRTDDATSAPPRAPGVPVGAATVEAGACANGGNTAIMSSGDSAVAQQLDLQQEQTENQTDSKMGLDEPKSIQDPSGCSVGQILNTLAAGEFPSNVEDLMQVISSIEGGESGGDEATGLPPTLDLLSDMMNISIEEQPDAEAAAAAAADAKSDEQLTELKKRQLKLERRLEFLRRKVHKMQARQMGAHVAEEIAGVFEYVHRSLKRLKDNTTTTTSSSLPETLPATIGMTFDRPKPMSFGSTKGLLKKLEVTTHLQASAASRQRHGVGSRYFGAGSCEPTGNFRCANVPGAVNIPPWPAEHKAELEKVSGLLRSELSVVQHQLDSEATDSSSGGESCDETQTFTNPHQQYLSIQKRSQWKFLTGRAAVASKWSWLQAQITDLEYRIRTYTDFYRQIRSSKGEVKLGGESPPRVDAASEETPSSPTVTTPATVNGYRGQLPGSSPSVGTTKSGSTTEGVGGSTANGAFPDYQCARTRPLVNFRKRRLLQLNGLHLVSKKAARPSTVRCGCMPQCVPCALCTGRTDPMYPRDPTDALSKPERIALVDPSFHPVFSMPEDVSCGIHCDAVMKMADWQQRSTRMKSMKVVKSLERTDKALLEHRSKKLEHRKKFGRVLKPSTASALTAKLKSKIRNRKISGSRHPISSASSAVYRMSRKQQRSLAFHSQLSALPSDGVDEEVESIGDNSAAAASNSAVATPSSSPLFHMQTISGYNRRNRANSYDIDNIVIPYSVAASTRVEKLQYKEILTPKWRIADSDFKCDTKNNGAVKNPSQDSDAEDLSEDAVITRHDKSEYDEKKKFLSYLKLPIGHVRPRAHKRTDSLAESSGANTPDAMSPHPVDLQDNPSSPMISPPATPLPSTSEEMIPLPSIAVMRRRTMSQTRFARSVSEREINRELTIREESNTPETEEVVPPFDCRIFPLDEDTYERMVENMPENSHLQTNDRAQDSTDYSMNYLDDKVDSPGSESTESALGEEDPNDPEWMDMEQRSRERHKR